MGQAQTPLLMEFASGAGSKGNTVLLTMARCVKTLSSYSVFSLIIDCASGSRRGRNEYLIISSRS